MAVSVYGDPRPYVAPHSRLSPPDTQHIRPRKQNNTYDVEDDFEMLKSHDKAPTFDETVEFRKRSAVEEAEKSEPESKEGP